MQSPNPLRSLFDVLGRQPGSHVENINKKALAQMTNLLNVELESPGRCILLRAPRAGYGKTHLLTQALSQFGSTHEFVLLTLTDGSSLHPGTVLEDVLRTLCRSLPAGGGLTELDLLARRVLALGLEPLVRSGEVPCQDRDSALAALRERATETFDFHHPNAVTAHWARENFSVLGPRLGFELSQRVNAPLREAVGWVEALYRFASTPIDQPARIGLLVEAAAGSGASLDRLGALLQLLSPLRRMVLVADELEGLSADPQSALRLASFVTTLRQSSESADVIIALNRDLWDSAFRPRISGGLEDRLGEYVIELKPLTNAEIEAIIESRVPGRGAQIASRLGLDPEDCYSRNVLRRAADVLDEILEENERQKDVPAPFSAPADASPFKPGQEKEKASPFEPDAAKPAEKPAGPPKPLPGASKPEAKTAKSPSAEQFASKAGPAEEFAAPAKPTKEFKPESKQEPVRKLQSEADSKPAQPTNSKPASTTVSAEKSKPEAQEKPKSEPKAEPQAKSSPGASFTPSPASPAKQPVSPTATTPKPPASPASPPNGSSQQPPPVSPRPKAEPAPQKPAATPVASAPKPPERPAPPKRPERPAAASATPSAKSPNGSVNSHTPGWASAAASAATKTAKATKPAKPKPASAKKAPPKPREEENPETRKRLEQSTGWSFESFIQDLEPVQSPFPDPNAPAQPPPADPPEDEHTEEESEAATSRVDELLAQFRARYGRQG